MRFMMGLNLGCLFSLVVYIVKICKILTLTEEIKIITLLKDT